MIKFCPESCNEKIKKKTFMHLQEGLPAQNYLKNHEISLQHNSQLFRSQKHPKSAPQLSAIIDVTHHHLR